jgi:sugar lactone lactonase YvrE
LEEAAGQRHGLYALGDTQLELVRFLRLPDDGFANDTEMASDGRLLVTDSVNGRVLAYDWARDAFETRVEDERLKPLSRVGVAGVTVDPQGRVYIANYETGELLLLVDGMLRAIALPRTLENPDGLALARDGALLVVEGAVRSGNGRLLRIPDPAAPGQRPIDILREGLESPVNLTVGPDHAVYVTESRIRRRIGPNPTDEDPSGFRVVVTDLRP